MMTDLFDFLESSSKPRVEPKPWMKGQGYTLALGTNDNLAEIVDACIASGLYALDLETTGLDGRVFNGETVSRIVGCCLSPDGKRGYYIPLRHRNGAEHNVSWTAWKREMLRLITSQARAIFHNGKFDQEFLQFCGGDPLGEWDAPAAWEDTMILSYLRNSRGKSNGLKALAKNELGMEMIELEELFDDDQKKGGDLDFSQLDPGWEPVVWYGAADAICTWNLFPKLYPLVVTPEDGNPGQGLIYNLEKLCVASTRWMERARILTDQVKAKELIRIGQREWLNALEEVYESTSGLLGRDVRPGSYRLLKGTVEGQKEHRFDPEEVSPAYMERVAAARTAAAKLGLDPQDPEGKKGKVATVTKRVMSLAQKGLTEEVAFPLVYDVLAPIQLGQLLRECQVPGLKVTEKSGQVATDSEELERVLSEVGDKYPFAKKIMRFREVSKALGTYLLPIIEDAASDGTLRAQFGAHSVETGRFNAKSSKRPKVDGGTRFPFHGTPATYDPNRPECMARVRECIISRPGYFIVAIDFSGVELRIVTNLSREPKWLREFFHCSGCDKMFVAGDGTYTPPPPPPYCPDCGSDRIGDLHTLTGIELYGAEAPKRADWKKLRGDSKACNFTLCYGGGGNAVVSATGCDKSEGWRIKDKFDRTYRVLSSWWTSQHKFARKTGYVATAFGRRYPVPDINHEQGGFRSAAERNAVNGPVQGTSADITKLAMGLIYKECKKRGWLDLVHMLITMHDELVFEIHHSILEEAIDIFVGLMCRNPAILKLGWPVPLTSDVEIGRDWTVPWDLKKIRNKGKCPPELEGLFKGVSGVAPPAAAVAAPEKAARPAEGSPPRIHRVAGFTLGEVDRLARLLAGGAGGEPASLRIEGPGGEDLTAAAMTVWGGPLPSVPREQ